MIYKKAILSAFFFLIAIYIPLVTAYAQVAKTPTPTSDSGMIATPTPIEYQLPYPGMLPDNPLYFLKVFRDDVTAFFLSKPLDKANFYLLQSDKNVEASYLLITQQPSKTDLALQTFSHAQSDFGQAITNAVSSKKQGYSTQDLIKKLALANQKHEQILQALAKAAGQTGSQTVQQEKARAQTFTQQIQSLQ